MKCASIYLGATLCKDGTCSVEVRIRIASAVAAMFSVNRIWRDQGISFARKFKLYKSLVTSIFRRDCKAWNLLANSEKKDPGFRNQVHEETSPYLLLEHKTNECMWSKSQLRLGPREPLLATVKKGKLAWFGHVTRHDSLSKTILQGTFAECATPWSAEGMLDGQHQRVDVTTNARTVRKGLLQKKTGRGSLLNRPSCLPDDPIGQGIELN